MIAGRFGPQKLNILRIATGLEQCGFRKIPFPHQQVTTPRRRQVQFALGATMRLPLGFIVVQGHARCRYGAIRPANGNGWSRTASRIIPQDAFVFPNVNAVKGDGFGWNDNGSILLVVVIVVVGQWWILFENALLGRRRKRKKIRLVGRRRGIDGLVVFLILVRVMLLLLLVRHGRFAVTWFRPGRYQSPNHGQNTRRFFLSCVSCFVLLLVMIRMWMGPVGRWW